MIRWQWAVAASRGEGACRTRSGSAAAARIRGDADSLTAIVGAVFPFPASAEQQPVLALHELVVSAQDSIDRHEIAVLVVVLGLVLFAVVTAIMLVRARTRWTRLETSSRDEIATLRSDLDRANALLFSDPQVMVDWPAGSDEPRIDGDPGIVGVAAPHRVLAFGSWLEAGKAFAMEQAVENLRSRGEGFSLTLTTLHGHPIEVQGRAIGGRAVLRLKDASGVKRDLVELLSRHESLLSEVASLRALIENLPSPVWTRDAAGQLTFANSAYARAVEAKSWRRRRHAAPRAPRQHRARQHFAGARGERLLCRPAAGRGRWLPTHLRCARFPHRDRQRRHRARRHRSGNHARCARPHGRCPSPHARSAVHRRRHVRCRSPADVLQRRLSRAVGSRPRLSRPGADRLGGHRSAAQRREAAGGAGFPAMEGPAVRSLPRGRGQGIYVAPSRRPHRARRHHAQSGRRRHLSVPRRHRAARPRPALRGNDPRAGRDPRQSGRGRCRVRKRRALAPA